MGRMLLLISLLALQFSGVRVHAGDLAPPFSRQWGEASSGLLQWAGQERLDVTVELPGEEATLQIYTFEKKGQGIPGLKLLGYPAHSIEARFHKDRLYELTVFLEFPKQTPDEVRGVFYEVKKHLTKTMGEFKLNGRSKRVDDSFLKREESFHYEANPSVFLLMVYSSLEDTLRKKGEGRFSLVYHDGRQGPAAAVPIEESLPSATELLSEE